MNLLISRVTLGSVETIGEMNDSYRKPIFIAHLFHDDTYRSIYVRCTCNNSLSRLPIMTIGVLDLHDREYNSFQHI